MDYIITCDSCGQTVKHIKKPKLYVSEKNVQFNKVRRKTFKAEDRKFDSALDAYNRNQATASFTDLWIKHKEYFTRQEKLLEAAEKHQQASLAHLSDRPTQYLVCPLCQSKVFI